MNNLEINERIAALSPEKRELLLKKLREKQGSMTEIELPQIHGRERKDLYLPFPLSEVQEVYWIGQTGLFDLSQQGTNIYMEYEISGLNILSRQRIPQRMEKTLDRLIQHYDMLRIIILEGGQQQILAKVPKYQVQVKDLRKKNSEVVQAELEKTRQRMCTEKTPLNHWPLFEFLIHHLDQNRMVLHIKINALIMDGTKRGEFMGKFFQLLMNPSLKLPHISCRYRDYVMVWEEFKQSSFYQQSKKEWMKRLPDLLPGPILPLSCYVEPSTPSKYEVWEFELIERKLWDKLIRYATKMGLSPSTILLSAFIDVVAYWSTTQKFSLGVINTYHPPVHQQINSVMGNFNTMVVIEADVLSGNFKQRAEKIQWQVIHHVDHSYFSGLQVLREMNRVISRSSKATLPVFFNSIINYSDQSIAREEDLGEQQNSFIKRFNTKLKNTVSRITQQTIQGLQKLRLLLKIKPVEISIYPTQMQLFPTIYVGENNSIMCKWQSASVFPKNIMEKMLASYQNVLLNLTKDESAWEKTWREMVPLLKDEQQWTAKTLSEDHPLYKAGECFYILNRVQELCPPWVSGQLYITEKHQTGLDGIVYSQTGELLMRTGYMARYTNSGEIEVLGKEDTYQVSILGYNVLTYEVECNLEQHPDVRFTVVRAKGEKNKKRLVAFVALRESVKMDVGMLKDYLQEKIPYYMIPMEFVLITECVEKDQFVVPTLYDCGKANDFVAPRNEMENTLTRLWEDLLEQKPISITEDFFDLGGNSLKVVQLYLTMQSKLQMTFTPADFYLEPTIEHLAQVCCKVVKE